MDNATKEVLLNLLKNLKESTQNAYHAHDMAWRTYAALVKMFPSFPDLYNQGEGVSFDEMLHWRDAQIRQLDAAIQLIEEWH
ncbi:MAG TPA: hypothetical protein VFD87_05195 [Phototrophicaceae bacterium]|nr:hypothetical protein [Phototrophicaceae bacterium]